MRKLLNTLYVNTEDVWLSLDGENLVVNYSDGTKKYLPLHVFEGIVTFTYKGASPALIGKCSEMGILYTAFSPYGRYLYHVGAEYHGSVHLRKKQFRVSENENVSIGIAKNMIAGKIHNCRELILRFNRNHGQDEVLKATSSSLLDLSKASLGSDSVGELRGLEGNAAAIYFSVFNRMILGNRQAFPFEERNRRPPRDRVNAMLSFCYMLLTGMCSNALKTVGLDPYVGLMHTDRSGRTSLALDLMEELRPVFVDRFVLNLINNRIVDGKDFEIQESGAVFIKEKARARIIDEWQKRKQEELEHPFIKEKISFGMIPHVQAMLLAKCIRGDLDGYPAFLWR